MCNSALRSSLLTLAVFTSILIAQTSQAEPVVIDVALTPAGDFKAKGDELKGFATQEGSAVKAENIIVPLKNLKTGVPLRDKHMKEKYLQVDKFPDAVLVSAEGKDGKGKGRIKIKNIEKEIAGTYKVEGGQLMADFPLKLSDFGITGIKYMGIGVDDEMKIHVIVPIRK